MVKPRRKADSAPMPERITRRRYLMIKAFMVEDPPHWSVVSDSVDKVALDHPNINMDEQKSWLEWERIHRSEG